MNICIVAPCAVPFVVGGAENLYWGLENYINTHSDHVADIVKLPSPENDFWRLLDSYRRFSELDLSGFDTIVSCKYPAWMVEHPRHVVYLQHKLRGLYDTYRGALKLPHAAARSEGVLRLLDAADQLSWDTATPVDVFAAVDALKAEGRPDELALIEFPGPIARHVLHALDQYALSPQRIHKYGAISQEVVSRADYFPPDVAVTAMHHPTGKRIRPGKYENYLFTASRLDGPKRIGLLVEAMRYVQADISLKIAGTGPEQAALREAAGDDPRIELLGHVGEHELEQLYADALGVLFVPFKEDYGLITLEAMLAAKPVVTTDDAGGPTELVRHGVNGWIAKPTARSLAAAIDELAADPSRAAQMGGQGAQLAAEVAWGPLLDWIVS